jgi:Mg2+-importing ATPase
MRQFGLLIVRLTVLLVLFVLLINLLFHRPPLESFLFALALAVGLTPELLPMITTVTLSRGALRLAGRHVIVKRLAAMHNLGAMDVLCTDKTGTLTEAQIRLVRHIDASGKESERVFELAYLNSVFETGLKSPLDEAVLAYGTLDVAAWHKLDEVPFDFGRRRVSVLLAREDRRLLVVKGAPEDILRLSTRYEAAAGDERPLDAATRRNLLRLFEGLGSDGFRTLGIAFREVPVGHDTAAVGDEAELVFAGFAAFLDPPKASAAQAVRELAESGVAVKIVTGDNERVTRHLCTELGLPISGVITGDELSAMTDDALFARAASANLFCRVTPPQKLRVLMALKRAGRAVGFLGDGINDAPSLHSADVGISVDSAVDVAKAAADMILLEHDLGVLHAGVLEGRRTFGNIMKYIMMGTSSNFGNMFSMAGASLFLPFLPMLPVQILLNNLLYDLSEIGIPFDRVEAEAIRRPRHWDMRFVTRFMLVIGPISSLFDFLTFVVMLRVFNAGEALFQTGWFVESMATQVLVIFVIRSRLGVFGSVPHPLLGGLSVAVVAVAALLPFTPVGSWFGMVPLPVGFFAALAGMVVAYLLLVECAKRILYRRFATP